MPRVLVPLAEGFEEIEAVTIIDVLRRGEIEVVVAGLDGPGAVEGSHGIVVEAEIGLDEALTQDFDMVLLPGGEPGATRLGADDRLAVLLQRYFNEDRPVGAICAAPRLLATNGLLRGRTVTSHPSVERALRDAGALYETGRVVRDGSLLTSRGPGTALEFAYAVLEMLGRGERAAQLRQAMLAAPA